MHMKTLAMIILISLQLLLISCASTSTYLGAPAQKAELLSKEAWLLKDFYQSDKNAVISSRKTYIVQAFGPAKNWSDSEYKLDKFNFVTGMPKSKTSASKVLNKYTKVQITRKINLVGIRGTVTEFEVDKTVYHTLDDVGASEGPDYGLSLEYPKETISSEKSQQMAEKARAQEIESLKNGPNSKFYEAVKTKTLMVGLPEHLLLLGWGKPEKINTTTGAWGVHKQYVYLVRMVYVKNGVVTSWQD